MTDADKRIMHDQAREFQHTLAIISKVRDALAAKVFETPISARDAREELYLRVQTLDAMAVEMDRILKAGADEKAIAEYAVKVASGEKLKD